MPTREYEAAREFLQRNESRYRNLVAAVKSAANTVSNDHQCGIKAVYSRGDKQGSAQELKSAEKLPRKLAGHRQWLLQESARTGTKFDEPTWSDLPDTIGITIVVHYPDQISDALQLTLVELAGRRILKDCEVSQKKEYGYYAHHLIVKSNNPAHQGLLCEVQCKTMLHDAWSTKMHDLTYKPTGRLGMRHKNLMEMFGDILEQVEQQSQLIRDEVSDRWEAGKSRRRTGYSNLFLASSAVTSVESIPIKVKTLRHTIEEKRAILSCCSDTDAELETLKETIDEIFASHPQDAWVLSAILASIRTPGDLCYYLDRQTDRWFAEVKGLKVEGGIPSNYLVAIPLAFSSAGSLDRAIEHARTIIRDAEELQLSAKAKAIVRLNMAHLMVDRQCYDPSTDKRWIQRDYDDVMVAIEDAKKDVENGFYEQSALDDLTGFLKIVFSDDPKLIREGIDACYQVLNICKIRNIPEGVAHCEAHVRMGWRKLLENDRD